MSALPDDAAPLAGDAAPGLAVGLIPAPELPARIVDDLIAELGLLLARHVDNRFRWQLESVAHPVIGADDDTDHILADAKTLKASRGWRYVACITDLPMFRERCPTLAEASQALGVAVLSLPALGAFMLRRRVREAVVQLVNELHHGSSQAARERQQQHAERQRAAYSARGLRNAGARQLIGGPITTRLLPISRTTPPGEVVDVRFAARSRLLGRCHLVAGMVRANRPWSILPAFRRVLAIAFATGAYGLIFPTLWRLSDFYEPARFVALMLVAIAAMTVWIIVDHSLWERRNHHGTLPLAGLYNLTTILTLLNGVLCYYAALYVLFLVTVVFLVPAHALAEALGHRLAASSFPALAWLVASVATMAGALGASLESSHTVRNATYGFRQRNRHKKVAAMRERSSETT